MSDPAASGVPEPEARVHDECYACPIGGLFLTARQTGPEAFEHLIRAASELALAAKAMVEVAERFLEQQRTPGATHPPQRVQHIDVE
jgi:hypothetical protein